MNEAETGKVVAPSSPPTSRASSAASNASSNASSQTTVVAAAAAAASSSSSSWVTFDEKSRRSSDGPNGAPNGSGGVSVAQIDVTAHEQVTSAQEVPPSNSVESSTNSSPQKVKPNTNNQADGRVFVNGKLLTSIYPENQCMSWIIPARFDPYKMPKTLISDQLTMPVEDYVTAMEMLVNDYRFRLYTTLYRRMMAGWLVISLIILIIMLFSGLKGIAVLVAVLFWFVMVAAGFACCLLLKKQMHTGIHHVVPNVNQLLIKHNLLVGVEDLGKLSCHKISILFLFFRVSDCIPRVMQLLSQHDQQMLARGLTTSQVAVAIDSSNGTNSMSGQTEYQMVDRAKKLVLKYSQSYVKSSRRDTIRFPKRPAEGVSEFAPLHCPSRLCLCQFLQKFHFERKPKPWYERFFLVGDLTIADLEPSVGWGASAPVPHVVPHL